MKTSLNLCTGIEKIFTYHVIYKNSYLWVMRPDKVNLNFGNCKIIITGATNFNLI